MDSRFCRVYAQDYTDQRGTGGLGLCGKNSCSQSRRKDKDWDARRSCFFKQQEMMISVHELSKGYGDIKALRGLSFEVQGGELFGVLGPDGAGKSTLFRILLSLLLPGSGTVRVGGLDPVRDLHALRKKVGYMPGKFALYENLSVEEKLQFFASVFGTTPAANYELIKEVYQQIEPFKKRPAGKLSGGMRSEEHTSELQSRPHL